MKYTLPQLQYPYEALEPYIDARTMELHHTKHHATYVAKLNEALEKASSFAKAMEGKPIEDILREIELVPEQIRTAIRNHGGGHYNHDLFWKTLRAGRDNNAPEGPLADAIAKKFGSFAAFQERFTTEATGVFGSGWTWLTVSDIEGLTIMSTGRQDTPLAMDHYPLLGIDVWEHAYYLKYQNRRPEYIAAWWHVVNWGYVEQLFQKK